MKLQSLLLLSLLLLTSCSGNTTEPDEIEYPATYFMAPTASENHEPAYTYVREGGDFILRDSGSLPTASEEAWRSNLEKGSGIPGERVGITLVDEDSCVFINGPEQTPGRWKVVDSRAEFIDIRDSTTRSYGEVNRDSLRIFVGAYHFHYADETSLETESISTPREGPTWNPLNFADSCIYWTTEMVLVRE